MSGIFNWLRIVLGTVAVGVGLAANVSRAEEPPAKRQVILLKLDDIVAGPNPDRPMSDRWQRVTDFLIKNKLKGSFGIICYSLEKDNPAYFKWINDVRATGLIEFWFHGYHPRTADEKQGEFEHGTAEEQRAIFVKSQKLAQEKLGFTFAAFGPHWSGTTDATDEALEGVPEIKIWLYGPKKPKHFSRLSLDRVLALENPTFVPDYDKFVELYHRHAANRDVLVLQGHPNQWSDERWAGFVKIIEFLQSKNCEFQTPSEYLTSLKPAK